jgi:hypothetical protein
MQRNMTSMSTTGAQCEHRTGSAQGMCLGMRRLPLMLRRYYFGGYYALLLRFRPDLLLLRRPATFTGAAIMAALYAAITAAVAAATAVAVWRSLGHH